MTDFKVGDRVEYVGNLSPDIIGHSGEFMKVGHTNNVEVSFDGEFVTRGVIPKNLKLLERVETLFTFEDYQHEAQQTAIYDGSLAIMYPALGLSGEVGELLNKIKKHYRDGTDLDKDDMEKEIGDILWYLSALCTDLDVDLGDAAIGNVEKLRDRSDRGVIGGSGDYR